ncbi:hypothetical protein GCM10007094_09680 [Pseudovibrio japonicus]|uniref:N-acetyltransferase domain-containing protein n=1 Tax=Pseudovibrio japonicus TaxID=366534 RepID=A0ABQ3E3J1_9HYPH|nr:hypothetical protein GCM10007094_09680 [Pseudovibrio japonicus]
MGEVHNSKRAKNQRKPKRNQGVGTALIKAVENLKNDGVHPLFSLLIREKVQGIHCGTAAVRAGAITRLQ